MVKVIADEKGLPEETVLDVVQMAIAAAWRRENGDLLHRSQPYRFYPQKLTKPHRALPRAIFAIRLVWRRTKIAVMSTVPGVDPVGTFVGGRGVRVQAITGEIGDREKIDIINWSENPSEYIREALSPAEVMKVEIDGKNAKVYVTEDQQSIAIGRQGQNVRLASKLKEHYLVCQKKKGSTHACSQSLFGELFTRSPKAY